MRKPRIERRLPEIPQLEKLAEQVGSHARVRVEATVETKGLSLPVYSFVFGSEDRKVPTLAFIGGVHGLERIGTRVVIAYLNSMVELLEWDEMIHEALRRCRILFYPIVNPGGMLLRRRSNPNGVDLMRNAPVDADESAKPRIWGGHRLSPSLPWYRGEANRPLELESQALIDFVRRELWDTELALSLDVHSGFGAVDRLWFPYAKSRKPFPHLPEVWALKQLLDKTYPMHIYCVEPQSCHYTAHGDLWDYMYDRHTAESDSRRIFLPMCLELGSWVWLKKNPRQIFDVLGAFNPIIPHRLRRALRRHILLFHFLTKAVISGDSWATMKPEKREELMREASKFYYEGNYKSPAA